MGRGGVMAVEEGPEEKAKRLADGDEISLEGHLTDEINLEQQLKPLQWWWQGR